MIYNLQFFLTKLRYYNIVVGSYIRKMSDIHSIVSTHFENKNNVI